LFLFVFHVFRLDVWEMVVRFVDIGGIGDHYYLNFFVFSESS